MARTAEITRKTNETDITIRLNLDGTGKHKNDTGIGFLNHMLDHLAVHGLLDLEVTARGDLEVDTHHTVEDCAIALGQAFEQALGDKAGISRIGSAYVPMDDSLAFVCLDFSGRPYAVIQTRWLGHAIGPVPVSQIDHFFESFAFNSKTTLHARVEYGRDDHHAAEALFKALGRSIAEAAAIDPRRAGAIPSTKGTLV
jgi:imidazoleglycerol-phosphate dehydratase